MRAGTVHRGWGGMGVALGLLLALAACGSAPKAPAQQAAAPLAQQAAQPPVADAPAKPACPPPPAEPSQQVVMEAMKNAQDHGFLWRVSKGGRTSYLYGTMHVGKLEWVFPGPQLKAALRASDTMALELDVLDPAIQKEMREEMAKLHAVQLPAALEARIRRQAEALCVPYEALAGSPPELQIVALDVMVGRTEGLDARYAVDATLAAIGHASHQRMVSLETPAFQIHALVMKNRKDTLAYVEDNLAELEDASARQLLTRMALAWANADYAEMERYPEWCECLRTESERAFMQRMLQQRNPAMAEKIDALHRQGRQVFAAVGSMHMFGPSGLPALLRQKGYAVERVDLAAGRAPLR